ncbi:N-acetylglucosamine-6-phosphate deacetylase [Propylenella binzhouense]|uniref:N-acetylglucosamine-6-phosphate deacetylase n=1 Tax=Propylenella binzhouense TaxID=2555902 RepID=A0A964T4G9_9HYPH|nr:amidohydrolase family protein [Propylenella binzhouense]MYZ48283.1 N-acetylglucosamine-6-phosphate deacetylase [Propylenella binzhouense]
MTDAVEGCVLTPEGWVAGRVLHAEGRIAAVEGRALAPGEPPPPPYVVPGFVDLHVHGGGGADAMEGEPAVRRLARFHARHGTTALAPTTVTAPPAEIASALAGIEAVRRDSREGEARVLGAHLEGPFISPERLGAQPPFAIAPDADLARAWLALCRIVVVTLAPELPGAEALIAALSQAGCRVQIGHSLASAEAAEAALRSGACGFTHLFNAMSGLDHRRPGVAAAALAYGESAEIIADLRHVAPAMIRAAARAVPRLHAVTDAISAAGMPDGAYRLGSHRVEKRGETVTMPDGATLAGSVLTMDRALENLVGIGLPLERAVAMTSTRPAEHVGRQDIGRIAPGCRADLVTLGARLAVEAVLVGGRAVPDAGR